MLYANIQKITKARDEERENHSEKEMTSIDLSEKLTEKELEIFRSYSKLVELEKHLEQARNEFFEKLEAYRNKDEH